MAKKGKNTFIPTSDSQRGGRTRNFPAGGFTLMETVIAIFILGIVSLIATQFLIGLYKFQQENFKRLDHTEKARKAISTIVYEVRKINRADTGAYPIESADGFSFIFYADIDDDSLTERVRYFLSGRTLKKGVIKPSGNPLAYPVGTETVTDLVSDVANDTRPLFYYYDANYDGTGVSMSVPANNAGVRMVGMTLYIDDKINALPTEIKLDSKVMVRNLKDNL